jgi:hypothetical protein
VLPFEVIAFKGLLQANRGLTELTYVMEISLTFYYRNQYVLSRFRGDYRRGMDW